MHDNLEDSSEYTLPPGWSEDDVEKLVGRVSQRVMRNFYEEVGRSVVKKMLSVIGLITVGMMIWAAGSKFKLWGVP